MSLRSHARPSRRPAALPPGLLRIRDCASLGWPEAARRHAAELGEIDHLGRGVFTAHEVLSPAELNLARARAAALRCERAALSHFSAGIAYGVAIYGPIERACVTVPSATALRTLTGVHVHRAAPVDVDVTVLDGYRVLMPARTVMDIAREHGVRAGVVAADHVLHHGLATENELAAAYERCAGWPGRQSARTTLLLADAAAESPLESLSRLGIRQSGLPAPRPQARICDEHGRFLGRCDFYWDEFGVIGEADGDVKYGDGKPAIVAERGRQIGLEQTGLIVVRWGWSDLFPFGPTANRLLTAFRRGERIGSPRRRWGVLLP